jgi:hypothetical protein
VPSTPRFPLRFPPNGGSEVAAVAALLRELSPELGGRIRPGGEAREGPAPVRLTTGIETLDALLGGGLPRGRLAELTGPPSTGRTSLALALLAATTRGGEVAAVVDEADVFDPPSAEEVGIDLDRVLWVRPTRPAATLRCAERLLEARGFALVVVDLQREGASIPRAVWLRLNRGAAASGTALLLLGAERCAGTFAVLALEARATGVRFGAGPGWLEGLDARLALARNRLGPPNGSVSLQLKVPPLARGMSARPGPAGGCRSQGPP